MNTIRRFILRLLAFFRSGRAEADLSREINAHLRLLEDTFLAQGMSADEARFAARRAFGGVDQAKAHQRDTRSFRWLDESWLDFKLGTRMLVKYPGLSLVGGLAMAVAIGFGTASFAFFYSYLYPVLPLDEGDRIVALENWDLETNNEERRSLHDFVTWRDEMKSVQDLGAFRTAGRNLIVPGGAAEPIRVAEMTASGFRTARVPPLLGRPLVDDDHQEGAAPVLVIGYDVWQTRFASDSGVVGREVRLGNTVHTIVGVMPEGFAFPMNHSYWIPLSIDASRYPRGQGPAIFIFGRFAGGVTFAEAQAELTTIGGQTSTAFPETHEQLRPRVLPYTYPLVDIQDVSLWEVGLMQLLVSMLLIVVAINVAILLYARTVTRQGEIAVRSALGASRGRIVGQLFIEALVLSSAAAALGLVLAKVALAQGYLITESEGVRSPFWMDYKLPPTTMLYVAGLTILAAVIAGVVPALQATGRTMQSTQRELSGSTGMQLGTTWTVLIVGQVAFVVAALPVAVALGWNEVRHATTKPEFAAAEFLVMGFAIDEAPPDTRFASLHSELVGRLETEAWVSDVALAMAVPGDEPSARVEVEGVPPPSASAGFAVQFNHVGDDFFDAFDVPVLNGRRFNSGDRDVAMVNRTFVQQILGGGNAVGHRVRYTAPEEANPDDVEVGRWFEIVGVVGDLHSNAINPELAKAELYHPMAPDQTSRARVIARVRGGAPETFLGRLREIASALEPTVRLGAFPLVEIYRQQDVALRLVALVLALITGSVLLLSAAGIYALMSFTVAQRRKEIGIRAALGAEPHRLLHSIFARAAGQLAMGLVIGLGSITLLDVVAEGELLGGKGGLLLPAIAALMLAAGLLAAAGPARRGLRIDPTEALREP